MCRQTIVFEIERIKILKTKLQTEISKMPDKSKNQNLILYESLLDDIISCGIFLKDTFGSSPITKAQQSELNQIKEFNEKFF